MMKINLFNFFRKRNEFQDNFPIAQFGVLSEEGAVYPLFLSLRKNNIHAYSTWFMIKSEYLSVIECLIELFYHRKVKINEGKERVVDHNKVIISCKFKGFGQIIVGVITNDNKFIKCLYESGLEPPGPENVFPEKNF